MTTQAIEIDHTYADGTMAFVSVVGDDELHYRYEQADGNSATLTATLNIAYGLTSSDKPFGSAGLTLDGAAHTIDIADKAFLYFITGTAQAGRKGILHIYTRPRPIQTA